MDGKSTPHENFDHQAGIPKGAFGNPFVVPDGYFDELERHIKHRALANEAAEKSFSVPESYFASLESTILSRIAESTLKEQVGSPGYTVPETYFETLSSRIQSKIADGGEEQVKVVDMKPKRRFLSFYKYAVAACICLTLGTFAYNTLQQESTFQERLVAVSDREILTYLEYHTQSGDIEYLSEDLDYEDIIIVEQSGFSLDEVEDYLSQNF